VSALARIGAVVRTDVLIRVRRPSSIAVFLLLCALAYLVVPPLSSGRTLMQVDGHRALLTSATIALATAGFVSILLGTLGFYLVSNTIRRDAVSRTGYVIAAMPVTNAEYLVGKYLGNVAFLGLVVIGCMVNVMGMHLLRAEGPLQPLVYLSTYLAVAGPTVCVVSAFALMFECVRPLSGRVGDVLYFFVWILMIAGVAGAGDSRVLVWNHFVDVIGMLFMIMQASAGGSAKSLEIGGAPFDPTKAPWAFPGIHWSAGVVLSRITSAMIALPILLVAALFFARFDPAKMKSEVQHAKHNLFAQLNRALKPLTRILLVALAPRARPPGLARIGRSETTLTFMLSPIALAMMLGLALWGVLAPMKTVLEVLLPLSFFGIVIATADIATRDATAGVTALLYSMPKVKQDYVIAKWIAASATALAFVIVPLARIAFAQPWSALSLIIGALFVASLAISLGTLTGSGKTFTGSFLLFLYLAMSSKGSPGLDFAGWNGVATNGVRIGYLVVSGLLVMAAVARQQVKVRE
jgi:hypothetical protein